MEEIKQKFKLGIDKNNNPIVTIDEFMHFFSQKQFHAFTLAVVNVSRKMNPEIDYIDLFK